NTRIDQAVKVQHNRLAALVAQIKHQDAQRASGIFTPDTHPSPLPRAGPASYGLRPSQAVPASSTA
ncbi:MAG: hypothetical protein QE265_08650, partial [Rhodoferax sp.]|nr:hypothetical protein [Rhodoferax sp.]